MSAQEIPPRRPTRLDKYQLGFTPAAPVRWLSPRLLVATAVRVLGAQFFGAYLDKRELQGVLPRKIYSHADDVTEEGDFWLDYVGDLGDGFDATYSIAWLLAQPELEIRTGKDDETLTLPRGHALVLGGDQVYPTPSTTAYEERFRGPYRCALPTPPERPPALYALPGNHDWYDGLTAFLRVFAKDDQIGGWRTQQARSYFVLQLPHRWWLFAVDTQGSADIDHPQLAYFEEAAQRLGPGDRVLVCVPEPSWVKETRSPGAYDTVDFFLRKVIAPTGATCAVLLTGDQHHYARYEVVPDDDAASAGPVAHVTEPSAERVEQNGAEGDAVDEDVSAVVNSSDGGEHDVEPESVGHAAVEPGVDEHRAVGRRTDEHGAVDPVDPSAGLDENSGSAGGAAPPSSVPVQLITCGGGGAYLSDTAWLPDEIEVPPRKAPAFGARRPRRYRLAHRYPSVRRSNRYAWGVFARLPLRNPGFVVLIGLIHTVLMLAFLTSRYRILTATSVGTSALVLAGTLALAGKDRPINRVMGFLHGAAHIGLAVLGTWLWTLLPFHTWPSILRIGSAIVLYGPVLAVVGTMLVAAYFLVAGRFSVNSNELFAGQGIEHSKCFLRIRIDRTGRLTVYPIGVDRVCRKWKAVPEGADHEPWIAPRRPLRPRLIERPVDVGVSEGVRPAEQKLQSVG